jgi:hypothetical protein
MQTELITPGPLLDPRGRLAQVGWARQRLDFMTCEPSSVSGSNAGIITPSSPRGVSSRPPLLTWVTLAISSFILSISAPVTCTRKVW